MEVRVTTGTLLEQDADTYMVFVLENSIDDAFDMVLEELNVTLEKRLRRLIESANFTGKAKSVLTLYPPLSVKRVILVGLGKESEVTLDTITRCVAVGMQQARDLRASVIATIIPGSDSRKLDTIASTRALVEGTLLGLYAYHGQKTTDAPAQPVNTVQIAVYEHDVSQVESGVNIGKAFAEGTTLTRDLVNLPPNICTPDFIGQQATAMAEEVGLRVDVLGQQQMVALKMGALLAVARGSSTPPRFVILEHNPDHASDYETVVLIGKGVTFDTGGYSLKTRDGMIGMKGDMGGGAAVAGAMKTIAMLDLPIHVVGLIPTADNRVSGDSYLPQEVITASNGKTIEIISTDAEGRLLLADALVYAKRFEPDYVIDIATLTGSSVVALGAQASSLFCTHDQLAGDLLRVGEVMAERVWRMPLYEEYFKTIESDTADMRNSAGRTSGVGSAAIFLKQFADFKRWAHVDMAGLGSNAPAQNNPYIPGKTATGYGSRLLAEYVRQLTL